MRRLVPALVLLAAPALADEPIKLVEKAAPGSEFHIVSNSKFAGELLAPVAKDQPPARVKMEGRSSIDYAEKILTTDPKDADFRALRVYERMDFQKTAGDRTDTLSLRPSVRRLVMMKKGPAKVPFSPDAPLRWAEIDMLRTDIVVPALGGLLPDKAVRVGDTWKASTPAVIELTAFEKIEAGDLECKLVKVETLGPRRIATVAITGTVEGLNEDGPVRQKLTGKLEVELNAGYISFLKVDGEHSLLDENKKEAGKITGTFELTRKPLAGYPALADKDLKLDPTDENTRLLFDGDDAGIRFEHARNWRVVRTTGRQITLDESGGAGLLITLDPAGAAPTAARYLREAITDLEKRGAKLHDRTPPKRLADGVDLFTLDVEVGNERVTMAYLIVRREKGGATLAARLPDAHREARLKELERLAQSFAVSRRLDGK